jgi:O-antigen ligase
VARYALFALVVFGLPHMSWFPLRFGFEPEAVPLGIMNLILIAAALLWLWGKLTWAHRSNPLTSYTVFLVMAVLGTGLALMGGFGQTQREILTNAKSEICLLALYFLPLAAIRDERDFKIFLAIALVVHFLVGYEVLSSGVLSGSQFNDGKRGSGPFGTSWRGSDVGGAYLAQVIMLFIAVVLTDGAPLLLRAAAGVGGAIVFLGILATYSRGSLLGVLFGFALVLLLKRFRVSTVAIALALALAGIAAAPESTWTRIDQTVDEKGELDESSTVRFELYDAGLRVFMDHPMGVGTGQVRAAMSHYLRVDLFRGADDLRGLAVDPHNGFIYTLASYGVLGLIVFLWVLGSTFWSAFRVQRDTAVPWIFRSYSLGMCGLIGSLVVCNMFYANFFKDLVLGTLVIHLGMSAWTRSAWEEGFPDEDLADEESEDVDLLDESGVAANPSLPGGLSSPR